MSGNASIIVKMAVRVTLRCNNHIVIATTLDITVSLIILSPGYDMYLGDQCEIRDCTRPDTCLHGECQLDSTCKCFEGWSGDRCDFNICDMVQCPEFSTCRNSTTEPDGYICECRKGFAQTPFGCMSKCVYPKPHCERGDCSLDYRGEPICRCHGTGYHGAQCNLKDCTDDNGHSEALCQSINVDYKCVTNIHNPDVTACTCKWDKCDCEPGMCSNGGKNSFNLTILIFFSSSVRWPKIRKEIEVSHLREKHVINISRNYRETSPVSHLKI